MSRKKNVFQNQKLFTPSVVRRYTNSSGVLRKQTLSSVSGSETVNLDPTGSFRYDPPGSPIKSSQQLPLDFSRFENHTFFSSAVVNTNLVFEKIINKFPFDGTRDDYDKWSDELTGFEKYVLDRYPSYTGYITLDGSGRCIEVVDKAGTLFPTISRKNDSETVLSPKNNPFFIELDIAVPAQASDNQYIFHHVSDAGVGYAAYTRADTSSSQVDVHFSVMSGSGNVTVKTSIDKGRFCHLSFCYDTSLTEKKAKILSGSSIVATSDRFNFGSIDTSGAPFLIGTGSSLSAVTFTPAQTLSASIDNFRVFHKIRSADQISRFSSRTLFASENESLKLNFRFNEATGSYQNSDAVLDHSGQSLHAKIRSYSNVIRSEKPYPNPMSFEDSVFHPTLFPSHPAVISLNETLLASAGQYDENNPNMITKLIPEHYLELAKATGYNAYETSQPDLVHGIKSQSAKYSVPGAADVSQPQIISALLYMWSRMFDELKVMIDHVSELVHVDYDSGDFDIGAADQFLPFLSEYYGFDLPNMFRNAGYDQFFTGENVVEGKTTGLQSLQNNIWRRVLINMPEILSSKGTVHSIKSLFRSSGIDPDRMFRFVEYGGSHETRLGKSRKKITEISTMVDFSGSLSYNPSATTDAQGFISSKPNLISSYLTGSRIEIGYPEPKGVLVDKESYSPHGISNSEQDGLLTSGSWTIESRFKFPSKFNYTTPQSLFRLHTTSSSEHGMILNLVADPNIDEEADDPHLTLYCRPSTSNTDQTLQLRIQKGDIFDGNKWYVAAGRQRNDEIDSFVSSSYFINLSRQENGEIVEYYTTSSLFLDSSDPQDNVLQNKVDSLGATRNASGSFIVVGEQTIPSSARHLNDSSVLAKARTTRFSGKTGHIRFWSKALTQNESREHAKNFTSLGVESPLKNFGFSHEVTGSFEKLRLDISSDQPVVSSDLSGQVYPLVDFSQQFVTASDPAGLSRLRGFEASKKIIKPERFDYSAISYLFDEPMNENKVRVAGFTQGENIYRFDTLIAPMYEIPKAAEPKDDVRFAIEFSSAQALNEDIMKIFATLQSLEDSIGSPSSLFGEEYYDLRQLREIYFNRLTGEVNYTAFFEFFRWLDESFDTMIENLIPKKTNYLGFNMIVEGHALERSRVPFGYGDIYLGENDRRNLKGSIFLRQLLANIRKF